MLRRRCLLLAILLSSLAPAAPAAVIRGKVTTALGVPIPGARVQLIQLTGGARSTAASIAGLDGSFELSSNAPGRFLLLTSPPIGLPRLVPQVGFPFYAGRSDLLTFNIALDPTSLTPQTTSQPTSQDTLRETPLLQLSSPSTRIPADQLLTHANTLPELSPTPGVFLLPSGETGTPVTLLLRGASPRATRVALDGVSAEDLGGRFDLSTLSPSGLASVNPFPALELTPAPSPISGLDAEAGTLALHTAYASTLRPSLTYSGDAGPLGSLRNDVVLSAAPTRADLLASFGRFDTSNDPAHPSPFHLSTLATNLGYHISGSTGLRLTLRRDVSASALPFPVEFFNLQPPGKLAAQNLYGAFTFETRTSGDWHNLLRYGLVRKRDQVFAPATLTAGLPVTITGANGYTASGIATLPPGPTRQDDVTDRDEYTYATDAPLTHFLAGGLSLRYTDERAAYLIPTLRRTTERRHLAAAFSLGGEIRHRLFFQASGFLDNNALLGLTGSPRLGLTYAPVRQGSRRFRGTTLHLTAATGEREPSLLEQGVPAQGTSAHLAAPRSRTLELSADQTLLPQKLSFHATYFHNQFSHDFEPTSLAPSTFQPLTWSQTLAFRTQGVESTLRYNPYPRFVLLGGYIFLAALVEQSASTPLFNPNIPGIPIGALSALPGARPFHRPPNTGFFSAAYSGGAVSASLRATFAGRSDDSTTLLQNPTLLLPNRNLSPAYTALDASFTYAVTRRIAAYTQLTNLLDNRHLAPIGYTSTPFLIRTGLRIRLGGE